MPLRSFSRYLMVSLKSSLIERALVERRRVGLVVQLDVELHAADAREVVLARVEEHALEQLGGGVERRRIARTQLAVDFDQRVVLRLDGDPCAGSPRSRCRRRRARGRTLRSSSMPASISLRDRRSSVSSLVGLDQHLAGRHVDDVGGDVGAFQIVRRDFHLLDLGLLDLLEHDCGDLLALRRPRSRRPWS